MTDIYIDLTEHGIPEGEMPQEGDELLVFVNFMSLQQTRKPLPGKKPNLYFNFMFTIASPGPLYGVTAGKRLMFVDNNGFNTRNWQRAARMFFENAFGFVPEGMAASALAKEVVGQFFWGQLRIVPAKGDYDQRYEIGRAIRPATKEEIEEAKSLQSSGGGIYLDNDDEVGFLESDEEALL